MHCFSLILLLLLGSSFVEPTYFIWNTTNVQPNTFSFNINGSCATSIVAGSYIVANESFTFGVNYWQLVASDNPWTIGVTDYDGLLSNETALAAANVILCQQLLYSGNVSVLLDMEGGLVRVKNGTFGIKL